MRSWITFSFVLVFGLTASSQDKKDEKITYEDHVKPIFRAHCFSCHNQNKKEGDLDLTNYTSLMQGGGSGAVVEPGAVGDSYLFALVNHDDEPAMPPEQPKIAEAKIAVLSKWIELGALENSASKAMIKKKKSFDFALAGPAVGKPTEMPLPAKLDRQPVGHAKRATGVTAMATSPWAPLTAIAGQKQVLLYDSKTRELKGVFPFPEGVVSVLKFSRNGSLLLAGGGRGGANGLVVVWNIKNGERIIQVGDELDTVLAADMSSDQKLIALGGPQKMIRVYSTEDNSMVYEVKKHTDWVTSLEFSPDGVLLCSGDRNGGVHVWEGFSGREYLTLKGHSKSITGISWRADSNIVATSSEDATIRLWEMNNGGQVRSWTGHGGGTLSVEFTRDGRLVSSGRDRLAKVWDQAGKQLFAFPVFADIAVCVTHCDESNTCFAGDWTGEIRQFNAADGKQLATVTSNPLPLEQQLVAAKAVAEQALAKSQQAAGVSAADKKNFDMLNAQVATAKKQIPEVEAMIAQVTTKISNDKKAIAVSNTSLQELNKRVAALTAAIPELNKAKANAVLALGKLPKDAELKKLADGFSAVLTAKETELKQKTAEMTTLTKKLADMNAAVKQAEENLKSYNTTLATTKGTLAKVEPMLKPAQEKYVKSQEAAVVAKGQSDSAQASVSSIEAAIAFSKSYRQMVALVKTENDALEKLAISHAESLSAANEAKKTMAAKTSTLEATKAKVAQGVSLVNQLTSKMESTNKSMAQMKSELTAAELAMAQTQAAMVHLDAAKIKIDEAQKASPNDAQLKAALESMVGLIAVQTKKITDYQANVKSRTMELATITAELKTLQEQKVVAEKMLQDLRTMMTADMKQFEAIQAKTKELETAAKLAEEKVKNKDLEISQLKTKIAELQGI